MQRVRHLKWLALGCALTGLLTVGCSRNDPPEKTDTPPPADVPAIPEASKTYKTRIPPLDTIGTLSLEEVGSPEALQTPATSAEAWEVIDAALAADDVGDRYHAVDGLIFAPWTEAESRLIQATADADPQVIMLALQQLAHRGGPTAVATLETFITWDNLWGANPHHPPAYRARPDFDHDATPTEALATAKSPAVEELIRGKLTAPEGGSLSDMISGIRLAHRYGADTFVEELAAIFSNAGSASARYHAAKTMYAAGINKEQMERFLRQGLNPADLASGVIALGVARDLGRTDWEPEIRGMLASPDATTRGQALEALGILGLPISPVELTAVMAEYDARGRLLERLHLWADPAVVIPLLESDVEPQDPDYYLVQLALARLGSDRAEQELLQRALQQTSDGAVPQEAIVAMSALAELDNPELVATFMEVLNRPAGAERMQFACLQGLGRQMDAIALPSLVRYYRNYRTAQPGLAAFAAAIAASLADPTAGPSQPPSDRLISPVAGLGRYAVLYQSTTARWTPLGRRKGAARA